MPVQVSCAVPRMWDFVWRPRFSRPRLRLPDQFSLSGLALFIRLPIAIRTHLEAGQPATLSRARIQAGGETEIFDQPIALCGVATDNPFPALMRFDAIAAFPQQHP